MAGRRVALYFSWDRPREADAALGELNNRYPALFELRRAIWPLGDLLSQVDDQSIGGFLDRVVLSDFQRFRDLGLQLTGHEVALHERSSAGVGALPLGEWLDSVDTLIIISLDHLVTHQAATEAELEVLRAFLSKAGRMLFVCPHHDVGITQDPASEQAHHGDRLVPGQQRIGGFGRSVLTGLGLEIENRFGLRPGRGPDGQPTPLEVAPEARGHALLKGVRAFNLHPHLPDLHVKASAVDKVHVLARQCVAADSHAHPALQAGRRMFNALLETRPEAGLGRIVICDATLWSSAFGGEESLLAFWANVLTLP